ncbi:MAG: hypothetical protein V1792_27800 [Pseudomonadota bacterium]
MMRNLVLPTVLIAALVVMIPGPVFADDAAKGSAEEVKKEARDTLGAAKKFAEREKQEYQQKVQAQLDSLSARLDDLKQKAQSAQGDALAKLNRNIADLEKKRADAGRKLAELKTAGAEAWMKLKSGLDGAVNELKNAFQGLTGEEK